MSHLVVCIDYKEAEGHERQRRDSASLSQAVVLGNKSGIVLSVLGGKGTPRMFDFVL